MQHSLLVLLCVVGLLATTVNADACSSAPCFAGATCSLSGSDYSCACPTGFRGLQCAYPAPVVSAQYNGGFWNLFSEATIRKAMVGVSGGGSFGGLWVFGGEYALDSTVIRSYSSYSANGINWSKKAEVEATTRSGACAFSMVDGGGVRRICMAGGRTGGSATSPVLDGKSWTTGDGTTWTLTNTTSVIAMWGAACTTFNGYMMMLAGRDGSGNSVSAYSQDCVTWTQSTLPTPNVIGSCAAVLSGSLLLMGGENSTGPTAEVYTLAAPTDTAFQSVSTTVYNIGTHYRLGCGVLTGVIYLASSASTAPMRSIYALGAPSLTESTLTADVEGMISMNTYELYLVGTPVYRAQLASCLSSPCQNGGTCYITVSGHTCSCVPGYSGLACQTDINECLSNPCQNGGTCNTYTAVNGYTCTCPPERGGSNCQNDVPVCFNNPCLNGGTCSVDPATNTSLCACVAGYSGSICQTDIDECASAPCRNGGTCYTHSFNPAKFDCICADGYYDDTCSTVSQLCTSSPCQNGGQCLEKDQCGPSSHMTQAQMLYRLQNYGPSGLAGEGTDLLVSPDGVGLITFNPNGMSGAGKADIYRKAINGTWSYIQQWLPTDAAGTYTGIASGQIAWGGTAARLVSLAKGGQAVNPAGLVVGDWNPSISRYTVFQRNITVTGVTSLASATLHVVFMCRNNLNIFLGRGSENNVIEFAAPSITAPFVQFGNPIVEFNITGIAAIKRFGGRGAVSSDCLRLAITALGADTGTAGAVLTYARSSLSSNFINETKFSAPSASSNYGTVLQYQNQYLVAAYTQSTSTQAARDRLGGFRVHKRIGFNSWLTMSPGTNTPTTGYSYFYARNLTGPASFPTKLVVSPDERMIHATATTDGWVSAGSPGVHAVVSYELEGDTFAQREDKLTRPNASAPNFASNIATDNDGHSIITADLTAGTPGGLYVWASACTDPVPVYACSCPTGFSGSVCQINGIDECASSPCRNGGTCNDFNNGYTCTCASGYSGDVCAFSK